jgi:hypothetical protein
MIRTLAIAVALAVMSTPAFAQTGPVERCGIFKSTAEGRMAYVPIAGYSVLLLQPPFRLPQRAQATQRAQAVVCDRTSIFVGPNDHRVITDLGIPLFIRSSGRVAVLEIADRQLRLRFTEGEPTPAEREAMGPAIERALADMERLPPRQTPAQSTP